MSDFSGVARRMVLEQIENRGIHDQRVLAAMSRVPRHLFVPQFWRAFAYEDQPLPIGYGQTISQPYMVAYMAFVAELHEGDKVLEIGTGCGYSAAVLSHLAAEIFTIESIKQLQGPASKRLQDLGCNNVHSFCGDGSIGLLQHAPYDAIIVTASAPEVPDCLIQQLKDGGRLIIPVEDEEGGEVLMKVTRVSQTATTTEKLFAVAFVPLIGEQGWDQSP